MKFKVGDGGKIRLWEDVWWKKESFYIRFPLLYRLSFRRNYSISDSGASILSDSYNGAGWNFHFTRNLNEREASQFSEFSSVIDQVRICDGVEDKRIWKADSSELFTCKSEFQVLAADNQSENFTRNNFIWKTKAPYKIKIFLLVGCP